MPLVQLPFDKLDFGECTVLDKFYNAEIVIVDMSSHVQQVRIATHLTPLTPLTLLIGELDS